MDAKKGILNAPICDGRNKYLKVENGIITFPQILLIPNLTCTLRCKYCAAGNQYAKRCVFDVDDTIEDFDKLMGCCKTKQVNIQGGEVFLNPQIGDFFEKFANIKNIKNCGSVELFTNATVIPTDEQLEKYALINLPKKMMISNYGLPSVKVDKFVEKIKKFNLDYVVFPTDRWWFHPGTPNEETGFSDEELKEVIKRCTKFCRAPKIIDGKFFVCGQNGYALYDKLSDYVDVRKYSGEELKREIYHEVFELEKYDICKYCRGVYEGAEKVKAAEQLK